MKPHLFFGDQDSAFKCKGCGLSMYGHRVAAALAEAGIELTFDLGIVEERCRETQGYLRFACGCYRYLDRYDGKGNWHRTQVFSFYSCSPEHAAWWRENPGD